MGQKGWTRYFPSLRDKQLQTRFRGKVFCFSREKPGKELAVIVYGKSLEEMRKRKHCISDALQRQVDEESP